MIRRSLWATLAVALRIAGAQGTIPAPGQPPDLWRDTTRHKIERVTVEKGVELHVLDFGGTGPTIVMLAGLGNTAHAWDDFAPRFTDRFHVVAITRRGFGESSHPTDGYDTKRLVEDIRVVLDRLHFTRVILVGHSIAGEELTRFAGTYPDRVSKLVYLDAGYDRPGASEMFDQVFVVPPRVPARPEPTDADTASAAAYVSFVHRTRGVNIPESDIRARYNFDGWNEDITNAVQSMRSEVPNYAKVRAPALAIYAVTDSVSQMEPWQRSAREYFDGLKELLVATNFVYRKSREQFKREVAHSSVVELHGAHHWLFVSNRDQCVSLIRQFLAVP